MIEVKVSIDIDRAAGDVFAYLSDMSNNTTWQGGMKECRWTSEPPIGVGSTYDQVAEFLGRRIVSSFEVVEHEPGRRIRIRTTQSTFPLDITRMVEPIDERSTRVSARIRGDPGRAARVLAPLMRFLVKRSVSGDYRRLKAELERVG